MPLLAGQYEPAGQITGLLAGSGQYEPEGQSLQLDWLEKKQPAGHRLKISTASLKTPDPPQRISAHLQRLKARLPPPNTRPPDSNITQSPNVNNSKQKNNHKPLPPPANMANPCSGSDVADREALATLSAAVVQRPLVASKMSTALL